MVKSIFAEYDLAEDIISFYKTKINNSEDGYVFVVPRKCLTEYKAQIIDQSISPMYENRGFNNARYATPGSFLFYVDEIAKRVQNGERFVISVIDDIIVHGRGICQFLDDFLRCFSKDIVDNVRKLIKVSAIVRNESIPFLEHNYPDIYKDLDVYRIYKEPSDLRRISDLFLNSFAVTMAPNTSFVNSWIVEREKGGFYEWLSNEILNNSDSDQEEQISYINDYRLHVIDCQRDGFFEQLIEFSCMRCYTSKLDKIVLVPYVLLKPLTCEDIDMIYDRLKSTTYGKLVNDFCDNVNRLSLGDPYTLKTEYLTRLISEIQGCQFISRFKHAVAFDKWSDFITEDRDALILSFQNTYYNIDEVYNAYQEFIANAEAPICLSSSENIFINDDDKKALSLFEASCFFEKETCEEIYIDGYFAFSNDFDEKRAQDGEERLKGITPGVLKDRFNRLGLGMYEKNFYRHLLYCMDSGKASLTIQKKDDYYVPVLKGGEQAYRLLTDNKQWVIKYLAKIESVYINMCLQPLIKNKMICYIDRARIDNCIDESGYAQLKYLIDKVEKSRVEYFQKLESDWSYRHERRIYMRDYYVERSEEYPEVNHDKKLKEIYDGIMSTPA